MITLPHQVQTQTLAKRLKGQNLVIPDLKPIFSHWPSLQNENYLRMKDAVDKKIAIMLPSEKHQKAVKDADPALLAARWWPTSTWERYQVMTDLTIWFGIWDDYVERLEDPLEAEDFRIVTKDFVARSFDLVGEQDIKFSVPSNPVIRNFEAIAERIRQSYDLEQREELLRHFDQYIDATRIETEFEKSEFVPSLERYWEVRTLTSGMGTLLGMSEYALGVKVPMHIITSTAYETLWISTIVINSVVNDLISLKKEMRAGSVLSSVAILFHQFNDLDLAVQYSVDYIQQLVDIYDRTAELLLNEVSNEPETHKIVSEVIDLFRMVNTGNLEWSLGAKRYGVTDFIHEDGSIEVQL